MSPTEIKYLQHLQREVNRETDDARGKFDAIGHNLEDLPLELGFIGMIEEIGKLARTLNKLRIASDKQIIADWRTELDRRFVTTRSMLDRIYLETRHRSQ